MFDAAFCIDNHVSAAVSAHLLGDDFLCVVYAADGGDPPSRIRRLLFEDVVLEEHADLQPGRRTRPELRWASAGALPAKSET